MTEGELAKARTAAEQLRGYQRGSVPSDPGSFPRFIGDELGLKIGPTIMNLIAVIQTLDQRLRDLEGED